MRVQGVGYSLRASVDPERVAVDRGDQRGLVLIIGMPLQHEHRSAGEAADQPARRSVPDADGMTAADDDLCAVVAEPHLVHTERMVESVNLPSHPWSVEKNTFSDETELIKKDLRDLKDLTDLKSSAPASGRSGQNALHM